MWTFLLSVAVLVLWTRLRTVTGETTALVARLNALGDTADAIGQRVGALETLVSHLRAQGAARPPDETSAPPQAELTEPAPPSVQEVPPATALPVPDGASSVDRLGAIEPTARAAEPAPAHAPPPATDVPPPAAETTAPAPVEPEAWELVVGTSWLNKIGVSIFVLGLALLLGYSFARIGAVGRVALAYAVSAALLATGARLERRPAYRTYGYGLVAGGWAAAYFTTYAMHGLSAARLIDSEIVASAALVLVAVGMIAHSLRYRSEPVTATAYVIAFGTLAITPLSGFSFAASLPLVLSLVFVAERLRWDRLVLLGLMASYGLFALREQLFDGGVADPHAAARDIALAIYWLIFEATDLNRMRVAAPDPRSRVGLVAINAAAFFGLTLIEAPDDPDILLRLVGSMGVLYLVSGVVRWRLQRSTPSEPIAAATRFTSAHAAIALSAALFGWLCHLRFDGAREVFALLVETEILLATALALRDDAIRGVSVATMTAVVAAAWVLSGDGTTREWPWPMLASTPVTILVALALYGNREWMRARAVAIFPLEHAYPWVGFLFVGSAIDRECPGHLAPLAGLAFALVLLESGLRGRREYLIQSLVAGLLSAAIAIEYFVAAPGIELPMRLAWHALPATALLCYAFAFRIEQHHRTHEVDPTARVGAAAMASAGLVLLAALEWRAVPPMWLAPAWAITAAAMAGLGLARAVLIARWHGYVLALAAIVAAGVSLLWRAPALNREIVAAAVTIVVVYLTGLIGRAALRRFPSEAAASRQAESAMASTLETAATAAFVVFKWRVVPHAWLPAAWAATGAALVAAGYWRARPEQRWQGYALGVGGGLLVFDALWRSAAASPTTLLVAALVTALLYATAAGSRNASRRTSTPDFDEVCVFTSSLVATVVLALLERRTVPEVAVALTWGGTAAVMLTIGFWRRGATDIRALAYALLTWSGLWQMGLVLDAQLADWLPWALAQAGLVYGVAVGIRTPLGRTNTGTSARLEEGYRRFLLVAAAVLLTTLVFQWVPRNLIVPAWGVEGMGLLVGGFALRERVLRLSGLSLLLLCLVRLGYDVRTLDALGRIISFVVLGLVLLTVSWVYTRFKDQIKRWL